MSIQGKRAFDLLKKIGFVRVGGTKEELQAATILAKEVEKLGIKAEIVPFAIDAYEVQQVKLEVFSPNYQVIEATAYGFSGSTPADGIEGELCYVENALAANLVDVEGKIVLVNGRMGIEAYERIVKAKAKAFVSISGTIIDKQKDTDLELRNLRNHHLKHGKLPGVTIRAKDAFNLIKNQTNKARITLLQTEKQVNSHNVIATIKGSKYPEEEISIFGHYDSVIFSTGVYDNGAGSVIVMELLHHFVANPPLRTLNFIWFGSEEKGLLGSKAFVEKNDVSKHVLAVNVDVAGPILGAERAMVTADKSLVNYVDYMANVKGFPLNVDQSVYSSDSTVFADKGVPAISFCRFGSEGGAFIHNRHDVIRSLSAKALADTAEFVKDFVQEMANAAVFPIPKKMPQNMVDEVDKYLRKEKDKK